MCQITMLRLTVHQNTELIKHSKGHNITWYNIYTHPNHFLYSQPLFIQTHVDWAEWSR